MSIFCIILPSFCRCPSPVARCHRFIYSLPFRWSHSFYLTFIFGFVWFLFDFLIIFFFYFRFLDFELVRQTISLFTFHPQLKFEMFIHFAFDSAFLESGSNSKRAVTNWSFQISSQMPNFHDIFVWALVYLLLLLIFGPSRNKKHKLHICYTNLIPKQNNKYNWEWCMHLRMQWS